MENLNQTKNTGYTFEQFMKETKNQFKKPRMVLADGVSLSVQASAFVYCQPQRSGLEAYDSYEVGFPSEVIEEICDYVECPVESDEEYLQSIYPYVPAKLLSEVVEKHGGIDREATFKSRLSGYKETKNSIEDKNKKAQDLINEIMIKIGDIFCDDFFKNSGE